MTKRPPSRIYAILAREAPVGVLFSRGPSRWVQCIRWNLETDEFVPGQWFKGRIYERRGDLSPNGQLMCYFASKQSVREYDKQSWTAVSRPPFLTALALWFQSSAYSGGGLFEANDKLLLNMNPGLMNASKDHPRPQIKTARLNVECGEDSPIEVARMVRDGWTVDQEMDAQIAKVKFPPLGPVLAAVCPRLARWLINPERIEKWLDGSKDFMRGYTTHRSGLMSKRVGDAVLYRTERIDGWNHTRAYHLEDRDKSVWKDELATATWADFDYRGRLVLAHSGRILCAEPGDRKFGVLADLRGNEPEEMVAPDWAREWPS